MPSLAERPVILERKRTLKMARSAHAYVRGNTARFYEWLAASPAARRVPMGPAIWICGDCHLGNLGPGRRRRGTCRDPDPRPRPGRDRQSRARSHPPGPVAGHRGPRFGPARRHHCTDDGGEWSTATAPPSRIPTRDHPGAEPETVRSIRREAFGRRWRHLAKERLQAVEPRIPLGEKFWALAPEEARGVGTAVRRSGGWRRWCCR